MTRADARRRAEEALAEWKTCSYQHEEECSCGAWQMQEALEALLAAWPEAKAPGHDRIAELESLLRECNAVCLCGCPDSEHEADECGESCGHDDHECIRVPKAVLAYVERLRSTPPPPSDAVREAAYQTGKAWASAEDDALKAHLGSRLRAHDAALREALDAAKGGPDA
ncbi:MAG: hypothetical protein LC136_04730 [Burkholderiales bacterium]|nr:hypothetical protein [Burkholderiales bacterium]